MNSTKYAVAALRVSTTRQGVDGDSPEAQKEQAERFASSRGIVIKKFFTFLESASKEQQPMQEAIDYCKNPKNGIDIFIVKSIDRFTRGGSDLYSPLKNQLERCGVNLIDIYGIISDQKVNTLEHLGFEYNWSVYSPSKKSEILEAERAKDEMRDIMSRMIGAEIRYTQHGYWMRQGSYGLTTEKVETRNGKRAILKPHPTESKFVVRMYELRAEGTMHDKEVVDVINRMGFKTRIHYKRDPHDRTKMIGQTGGEPLTVKAMQRLIAKPIYAGINTEKWTDGKPVRISSKPLVSVEAFNAANRGKITISESDSGEITITTKRPPEHLVNKGRRNPDFPYRKFVLCPTCERPLLGSASRGKSGKYYPAYHCSNHGHYFRIPKEQMEESVQAFIRQLIVPQETIDQVMQTIEAQWKKKLESERVTASTIEERIRQLHSEAELTIQKIKMLSSETAIRYMEEDVLRIESEIKKLKSQQADEPHYNEKEATMHKVLSRARYFLEHLDELLIKQINPVKKAQLFGALFTQLPTYENLKPGTLKTPHFTGVHPLFALLSAQNSPMVTSRGIEPRLQG